MMKFQEITEDEDGDVRPITCMVEFNDRVIIAAGVKLFEITAREDKGDVLTEIMEIKEMEFEVPDV